MMRNYAHVLSAMPTIMAAMLTNPAEHIEAIISRSYELGITEGLRQARQMLERER